MLKIKGQKMNLYDNVFSQKYLMNEQIARQVFEALPDGSTVMVIMDRDSNIWPSDSEAFSKLNIDQQYLTDLQNKIDDGVEPVIARYNNCMIVSTALYTEKSKSGYIALICPEDEPEITMANVDFIEIILNQVNLIAKLIEKNTLLYELQMRRQPYSSGYLQTEAIYN
jgi:hypothetical protein